MSVIQRLEIERQVAETRLRAFRENRPISLADASEMVALAVEAARLLDYTKNYPRRALGEAGLDAADFREICHKALSILDTHLTLSGTTVRFR